MMRRAAVCVFVLAMVRPIYGSWARRFEGIEGAHSSTVAALPNGGYALGISGTTTVLVIVDAGGEVQAARKLEGLVFVFLCPSSSGDIYAGLRPSSAASRKDDYVRVIRFRRDLGVAWSRHYDVRGGAFTRIVSGTSTRDGGVVLAALVDSRPVAMKLNAEGDVES